MFFFNIYYMVKKRSFYHLKQKLFQLIRSLGLIRIRSVFSSK